MTLEHYHKDILVVEDTLCVSMKFIESIDFGPADSSEDHLAAYLRGDMYLKIVTASGKEYMVLVSAQMSAEQLKSLSVETYKDDIKKYTGAIYRKWLNILSK